MKKFTVGLVGNPNCGKTTLFNVLTGTKQQVGNWPGVTVEKKSGTYFFEDKKIEIIDLPGIYSLSASSLDEHIARNYVLNEKPDLILNIIDGTNIERNLYLTTQLIEINIPVVIALNMMDIIKQKKIKIDFNLLSQHLNSPVLPIIAKNKKGINELKKYINKSLEKKKEFEIKIRYPNEVEKEIDIITKHLISKNSDEKNLRSLVIDYLDSETISTDNNELKQIIKKSKNIIENSLDEETDIIIADTRYGYINSVCRKSIDKSADTKKNVTDNIDKIVLNRFLGIPIFFAAMYLTFWLTINFGGCFIDFFDGIFGAVFVDGFGILLEKIGTPIFLKTLLANGIGSGIQTISTFIPPISMMFFCLAILEDSGYMSRAAFVMDRFMRAIGLPGKAFVPMLVGFGCNVPAIMATRTLDEEKDRILTIMMNPFMSCGARIPVYALFATLFFPNTGGNIVFSLYLVGIIVAIITGFLFKKTILKGETSLFIMELPPYHIPTLKSIFLHTWYRLKSFIFRAGKAILIVVIILNLLNSIGIDGSFGNENTKNSILSKIGKSIVPIFKPMGITENNWPATVGIFTGIFAKESVVGTLDSLYTQIENKQNQNKIQEKFDFFKKIKEAFSTIPETLSELNLPFSITGLLGIEIEKQEVKENTLIFMKKYFDGKIGAYAYLLLILLYMPCVAAIAAVYRETNIKWTIFISLYSSALAWLASVLFYQIFTISKHPKSSICWIITIIVVLISFIGTLHLKSKNLKINKLLQK